MVNVVPANVQDRDGADQVVREAVDKYPSLGKLYVDSGYAGTCAVHLSRSTGLTWRWFGIRPIATWDAGSIPTKASCFPCWRTARASWCCRNGG